MLTPNPNECNSTLTSDPGGTYPYPDTWFKWFIPFKFVAMTT